MTFPIFEAIMLICFGIGWPISIIKSLRTKMVKGKSPMFMGIVWVGYLSGIIHKIFWRPDLVIILYIFNIVMITIDLILYFNYLPNLKEEEPRKTRTDTKKKKN
ncbi:MAG: hypothetical protein JW904_12670 [Spirochaetales bacterium]|nr:hypothetical protein [Spirochaetales bacterium]